MDPYIFKRLTLNALFLRFLWNSHIFFRRKIVSVSFKSRFFRLPPPYRQTNRCPHYRQTNRSPPPYRQTNRSYSDYMFYVEVFPPPPPLYRQTNSPPPPPLQTDKYPPPPYRQTNTPPPPYRHLDLTDIILKQNSDYEF